MATVGRKITKRPLALEILFGLSGLYLFGIIVLAYVKCNCSKRGLPKGSGYGSIRSAKHLALEDFRTARKPVTEAYVISLHESKFNVFEQRNFDFFGSSNGEEEDHEQSGSLEWFQAYDGTNETVLEEFAQRTGLPKIDPTARDEKGEYASSHAVGCYLSHWKLLENVQKAWKETKASQQTTTTTDSSTSSSTETETETVAPNAPKPSSKPDMLFILEDDTHCVSNLVERVWDVVQKLPKDWDMLYIGGKPGSYYMKNQTITDIMKRQTEPEGKRPSDEELKEQLCRGDYGVSRTGPFAPGTTKDDSWEAITGSNLAQDPPYWQTKMILNTNSYLINPKRIERVLRVLAEPMDAYKPIDVKFAYEFDREFFHPWEKKFSKEPLKAYMTPHLYCDQGAQRRIFNRDEPVEWEGLHWIPWKDFKSFPASPGFMWGKTATRDMCSEFTKVKEETATK